MKLLIDTTNKDLYIAIINENITKGYIHLIDYKKKTDIFPVVYKKLMRKLKLSSENIKEVYVVNGPGSFMGIRAGIVFAKTFALVGKKELYEVDNLTFISKGVDGIYYVDAKGGKSYKGTLTNGKIKIVLTNFKKDSVIDYSKLIDSPFIYLKTFSKIKNIVELKENYIKEPQVGGK